MEPEGGCWVWDSHDLLFLVVTDITLGGLEIGVLTMKKGEVARFIFSPSYAYGQQGCLPLIPPDATVLFEVELIDFLDSADSDTFFALTAVSCLIHWDPREALLRAGTQFGHAEPKCQHSGRDFTLISSTVMQRSHPQQSHQRQSL